MNLRNAGLTSLMQASVFGRACPIIFFYHENFIHLFPQSKVWNRRETSSHGAGMVYHLVYHITTSHPALFAALVLYLQSLSIQKSHIFAGLSCCTIFLWKPTKKSPSVKRMAGMKANMIFKLKVANTPSSLGMDNLTTGRG